jgi:lipoate---protein ligase
MLCIYLENTEPFFCLAAEEYLLKNFKDDIFMLWQSKNTVVVGKHQNLLAEINYPFCLKNNVTLARRISGGGAVYHDAGNINFSFIKNVAGPHEISFHRFTEPIREFLIEMGVNVETSGRNDLVISGLKISGNAEHVYKNRVLHHGTMLFNSDLKNLRQALKVIPDKYQSKAVQSNRSQISNISSFLKQYLTTEAFAHHLFKFNLLNPENSAYRLNETDIHFIEKLALGKFSTFEWRFGYSPSYTFKNNTYLDGKKLSIDLSVKQGVIEDCLVSGNYFSEKGEQLGQYLKGKKHLFEEVKKVLVNFKANPTDDLVSVFF